MKFQIVRACQIGNESLIGVRFLPTQLVIEMNDGQDDTDFAAQLQQQPQQTNGVCSSRNSHAQASARRQ